MTKTFYLIRHGESQSNANEKTQSNQSSALTQKGHTQAREAAHAFPCKPDRIITSRYLRTQQTAKPLTERFNDVAQETWEIHEFSYLAASRYKDKTFEERKPFAEEYWKKADPDYKDEGTGESFTEFAQRSKDMLEKIRNYPGNCGVGFSHGYMMTGIIFALEGRFDKVDAQTMHDFRDRFINSGGIANCARIEFEIHDDKTVVLKNQPAAKPRNNAPQQILD